MLLSHFTREDTEAQGPMELAQGAHLVQSPAKTSGGCCPHGSVTEDNRTSPSASSDFLMRVALARDPEA